MSVTLLDLAALSTAIYEQHEDLQLINPFIGKWRKTLERYYPDNIEVSFTDSLIKAFAKESKNPIVVEMANKKIRMDTGLRTALYVNDSEKKSVLVIRGTALNAHIELSHIISSLSSIVKDIDLGTLFSDVGYVFNNRSAMLDQVISFFRVIKESLTIKDYPIVAVTGHSLGGIMAKMLAPVSKVPTYAFNSPGVMQYLREYKSGYPTFTPQEVVTYCAQGDPIGNFRHDNDVGIKGRNYVFVPIGTKIPETADRVKSKEFREVFYSHSTKYHSMGLMYKTLLSSADHNVLTRKII